MIAYGIRNVPDMGTALEEFHRVLRPGGTLLVLEFSLPSAALLKRLYLFYFEKILPRLGGAVPRDPEAYAYLPHPWEPSSHRKTWEVWPGTGDFTA